ncbi:MAG: hypothetical protein WA635_14695 [Gallionella sp.]
MPNGRESEAMHQLKILPQGQFVDEICNLHLRADYTHNVWQSYRASLQARPSWQYLRLPFVRFQPHRIDTPLDTGKVRRPWVTAIGTEMQAHVCIARLLLYQ